MLRQMENSLGFMNFYTFVTLALLATAPAATPYPPHLIIVYYGCDKVSKVLVYNTYQDTYLPIQNLENISPKRSSVEYSPPISWRAPVASL